MMHATLEGLANFAAVLLVPLFIVYGAHLWTDRECGRHAFTPRSSRVYTDGAWRDIYIRDVCSHCGLTIERTDDRSDAKPLVKPDA